MAKKQKPTEINSWFNRLIRWLRTLLGVRREVTSTVKSRRYSSDRSSALFTLERNTPGATETWRVVHVGANGGLLVTLDNLSDCRQYYQSERRAAREAGRVYQTTADERGLRLAGGKSHTHRFSFSWLDWSQKKHRVKLLGVWDGDFAGFARTYSVELQQRTIKISDEKLKQRLGNTAAVKIGEMIAEEILELKSLPGFSWEERISGYDWQELLQNYARRVHKIRFVEDFDAQIVCRSR